MTELDNQWPTLGCPVERLRRLIVILNEGQDPLAQRLQRREAPSFQRSPRQDAEPHLDLIEPRCVPRRVHKLDPMARICQPARPTRHRLQPTTPPQVADLLDQPTLL